ncbi:MAG: hypothetical protein HY537_09425 [Deltaproteobacteria bacterium]|nr:hypothetical protein [Deltaproteobacteria bacterium]
MIKYRDHLRENYSPTSINRKLSALSPLFQELCSARVAPKWRSDRKCCKFSWSCKRQHDSSL